MITDQHGVPRQVKRSMNTEMSDSELSESERTIGPSGEPMGVEARWPGKKLAKSFGESKLMAAGGDRLKGTGGIRGWGGGRLDKSPILKELRPIHY